MNYREKYDVFIYEDYKIFDNSDEIKIEYIYKISDYVFKPVVVINKNHIKNKNYDRSFLDYLFFNFGIINAINYYKLTCAKKIKWFGRIII